MATPAEHLTYLRQKGYTAKCPSAFSDEETAILDRYGHWMEALTAGLIHPATTEREHFLSVARGQAQPETPFERVWHKLRSQPAETDSPSTSRPADPSVGADDLL